MDGVGQENRSPCSCLAAVEHRRGWESGTEDEGLKLLNTSSISAQCRVGGQGERGPEEGHARFAQVLPV